MCDFLLRHLHTSSNNNAEVAPLTQRAVNFVFSHCKQLDFGSVLGPNGQISLSDDTILQVLRARVRAEAITDFSLQPTFSAFSVLKQFLESYWIPVFDSSGFPTGVGHGVLCNIPYPIHTYYGGATLEQGQHLLAIWNAFND